MRKTVCTLACAAALALGFVARQGKPQAQPSQQPPTLIAEVKGYYDTVVGNISKAAEQFPEDKYGWQPTPEVRTWGRLIAHIIDDNNGTCSAVAGIERPVQALDTGSGPTPAGANLKKADLTKMLADSIGVCGKAFATVNETNMMERAGRRSKIGALIYNTSHTNEHYGNLVTYMRLQNMVPPSSQRGPSK
jgi:hypothetical protein